MIICPYLYILFVIIFVYSANKSDKALFGVYYILLVVIYIPNMVYAFILAKRGVESAELLSWDMHLKLFNIPIYVSIFGFGLLPPMTVPLAIFDYLLLLPSSMYGVSGLIQALREGKITLKTALVNGILHFIFCADVISAVSMHNKVCEASKEQP